LGSWLGRQLSGGDQRMSICVSQTKPTKIESVSCGWGYDHQDSHDPFQQIWSDRCSERLGSHPEFGPRQHTLTARLAEAVVKYVQTYRPISLITRDWPIRTEMRLPKALSVIKKLRPLAALVPKTAEKNRLAVTCSFAAMTAFGTGNQLIGGDQRIQRAYSLAAK
jgi:hypothetical protein